MARLAALPFPGNAGMTEHRDFGDRLSAVERIQGEHSLQMGHSSDMMASALSALQAEVGKLVKIGELQVDLQLKAANASSGLERLNERWREHEEFHSRRDLACSVVADRVNTFRGALLATILMGGAITTLVSMYFNSRLSNLNASMAVGFAAERDEFAANKGERDRIERRVDRMDTLFRESQLK